MTQYIDLEAIVSRLGPAMVYPAEESAVLDALGLSVSEPPHPYVAPKFRVIRGNIDDAEVISIQAPAAVGKSVTAQHLSANTGAPMIDLATVAVGAHSLRGMLSAYSSKPGEAIGAFHAGDLPIIIDAIDEGVLRSGVASLESFIETAVTFMSVDGRARNRVKMLILGRDDSIRFRSNLVIDLSDANVTVCEVKLEFFDRHSALKLIPLYAKSELDRLRKENLVTDQVHQRRVTELESQPMKHLINAHFQPIEFALGLPEGELWKDEKGQAFAGYAPVLSSIGTLLAQVDNPVPITNKLKQTGTAEAWKVIATVIEDILEREQDKLKERISYASLLTNPYAPSEQMTYLVQLFHGDEIQLVSGINLALEQESDYRTKVEQICREHPFVRESGMTNDVLGSKVLAHAVTNDLLADYGLDRIKSVSRQPFLWRFLQSEITSSSAAPLLIDGRYLGCVLASYWNDPIEKNGREVRIRDAGGGLAEVTINSGIVNEEMSFLAMPPIFFYSCVRGMDLQCADSAIVIEGSLGDASLFQFGGDNTISCHELKYTCASASLDGTLWFDAEIVEVLAHEPRISLVPGAEYGWGEAVRRVRPWRSLQHETLLGPQNRNRLVALVEDCRNRIRNSVVIQSQYTVPENDPSMNWARRVYGDLFSLFLKNLVDSGLVAAARSKTTSGNISHFTVNFGDRFWENLLEAVHRHRAGQMEPDTKYQQFLDRCAADARFELD